MSDSSINRPADSPTSGATIASGFELARLEPEDLDEILMLQHGLAPVHRWWSEDQARAELCDAARDHGNNTLVARRNGVLVGVAGWVEFGAAAGEFYAAPLVAMDTGAAAVLIDRLVARARQVGAAWIRSGAWPGDAVKRGALEAAGFDHVFDFVDLALDLDAAVDDGPDLELYAPADIAPLSSVTAGDVDPERFAALYNQCFTDVPNSPAIDAELARETWTDELLWPEVSEVLVDAQGTYRAFLTMRHGGAIDVVGVCESMRRKGLARTLMQRAIARACGHGVRRISSMCATSNAASLALHHALGFVEIARAHVWQLDLKSSRSPHDSRS